MHRGYYPKMAVDATQLRIVTYPAAVLRQKATAVEQVDDQVRQVAAKMIALMHEAHGVGLAATQVGLTWRMFVTNPTGEPGDDTVFVNPVLRQPDRELDSAEEGCLSLPDIRAPIQRPVSITVEAQDLQGQTFEVTSSELAARIWQHETDHLDGILILDRMSHIDRIANRRAIKQLERDAGRQ